MDTDAPVKRPYRSPLRAQQAGATRRAIIEAAAGLFVERGYGATSIEAIADAAGVSRATVFSAVGGKPTLLKTAYDVALVGDDQPIPMPDRAGPKGIAAEPDAHRFLERYAGLVTDINGRLAAICEAIRGAATADPEVRPVWDKIQEERRIGATNVVAMTAAKGPMRPGIDHAAAADVVWVLIDAGLYHSLVKLRGWPADRFRDWLAAALAWELLAAR
ncbi:MAG: TetR/AcrR family transcriptional regulator [Chloroflexota bacterium]|nr:TetR/AcrR family transcriptional regulator [Chloroflexota bacterium]